MTYTLFWVRQDRQGDYAMGTYPTRAAAIAAIPEKTAELIDQCPGPQIETNEDFVRCRDAIIAGQWIAQETPAQ